MLKNGVRDKNLDTIHPYQIWNFNKKQYLGKVMSNLVCYCFGYTESNIRDDVIKNYGRSTIQEKIANEKKKNNCLCHLKHPQKR